MIQLGVPGTPWWAGRMPACPTKSSWAAAKDPQSTRLKHRRRPETLPKGRMRQPATPPSNCQEALSMDQHRAFAAESSLPWTLLIFQATSSCDLVPRRRASDATSRHPTLPTRHPPRRPIYPGGRRDRHYSPHSTSADRSASLLMVASRGRRGAKRTVVAKHPSRRNCQRRRHGDREPGKDHHHRAQFWRHPCGAGRPRCVAGHASACEDTDRRRSQQPGMEGRGGGHCGGLTPDLRQLRERSEWRPSAKRGRGGGCRYCPSSSNV